MHYYKFNIADYRKDTGHLSTLEHGIYRQLIDWYYLDEKPIPAETQTVTRRLRLGSDDELQSLKNVLNDFFYEAKAGWVHKRIDVDIKDYHEQAEKNKANGKRGGRPKKTQSVIDGLPDESQKNPNQEPITNNHKPKIKATVVALPDGFPLEAWMAFVDMRKKIKKPMTDHAMKLMIGKLEKMKAAGQDIQAVLEQSITKSWSDVYDVKEQQVYNRAVDIAHQTTPTPKNHDAALRKIEEDSKKAVPIPANIREKMASILGAKQ